MQLDWLLAVGIIMAVLIHAVFEYFDNKEQAKYEAQFPELNGKGSIENWIVEEET